MKKAIIEKIGKLDNSKPDYQIPSDGLTTADNVVYRHDCYVTADGYSQFFATPIIPYHVKNIFFGGVSYWITLGLAAAYIYDGSTNTNITRTAGAYTGTTIDKWTSCNINGVPVFNNFADVPQYFSPISTATDLQNLTAWTSTWRAKVVRSYKSFLIALYITKSGSLYEHMVKWSDVADSGTVPASWDETDPTVLAGENELSETDGVIVDGLSLGDEFFIYKEDAVYGMAFIGAPNVFRFRRVRNMPGLFAQQCVVQFIGGHFAISGTANRMFYINDGQAYTEVGYEVSDEFFSQVDSDNYRNTFCVHNASSNEIYICFPSSGSVFCNKAYIWNYEHDRWTTRDIPEWCTHADVGVVIDTAYTWETIPYTSWNEWNGNWETRNYSATSEKLVFSNTYQYVYRFGDGNQFNGVNPVCTVEKTGTSLGHNFTVSKLSNIYIHASGNPFNVYVGTSSGPGQSVSWSTPVSFDPSTDYKVNVNGTGILIGLRFQSNANVQWKLYGYDIEYREGGKR